MSAEPVPSILPFRAARGPVTSVAAVISAYTAHLAARVTDDTYSANAFSNVSRFLKDFGIEAGPLALSECRQFHLSGWLTAHASDWSSRYRQDAQNTVLTCFRWAEDEQIIERSPFRQGA